MKVRKKRDASGKTTSASATPGATGIAEMTDTMNKSGKETKPHWYDKSRAAIVISLAGFVLTVFPAWLPIISNWSKPNFIGIVYAFDWLADAGLPMKTGIQTLDSFGKDAWERACISTAVYIEITNNTSHRLVIDRFDIQNENRNEQWVSLEQAFLVSPFVVEWSATNVAEKLYYDYSATYFDKLLESTRRTVDPGESLQGWTFLRGECSSAPSPKFIAPPWRWWPLSELWGELIGRSKGGRVEIYDTLGGKTDIKIASKRFSGANSNLRGMLAVKQALTPPAWADAELSRQ